MPYVVYISTETPLILALCCITCGLVSEIMRKQEHYSVLCTLLPFFEVQNSLNLLLFVYMGMGKVGGII